MNLIGRDGQGSAECAGPVAAKAPTAPAKRTARRVNGRANEVMRPSISISAAAAVGYPASDQCFTGCRYFNYYVRARLICWEYRWSTFANFDSLSQSPKR